MSNNTGPFLTKLTTFLGETVQPTLASEKHVISPKSKPKPKAKPKVKPKRKASDFSWDSRKKGSKIVIEADGVTAGKTGYGWQSVASKAMFDAGKWSFDIVVLFGCDQSGIHRACVAVGTPSFTAFNSLMYANGSWCYVDGDGDFSKDGRWQSYGSAYQTGDRVTCIVDADAGSLEFFVNGKSQGTAITGITGPFYPGMSLAGNGKGRIENVKQL